MDHVYQSRKAFTVSMAGNCASEALRDTVVAWVTSGF